MGQTRSFNDVAKGIVVGVKGPVFLNKELARPFINELAKTFRDAGLKDQVEEPVWYEPLERTHARADLSSGQLLISFGIFLASSIGSWAVEQVSDFVWNKTKTAFRNLRKKYATMSDDEGKGPATLRFIFEVHYESDRLSVIVEGDAESAEELDRIGALVPEAQKLALNWVATHGITATKMRFTIKHGELGEYPRLE